jgi:hypothetical protein
MKTLQALIVVFLIVVTSFVFPVSASARNKKNVNVVCHYMTWFKFRTEKNDKIKISHWKWSGKKAFHDPNKSFNKKLRDIYSSFYPRIGIYDSGDPLVMDYHILTAKVAGISTFIVDWYNPGANSDIVFEKLLERCEKLNMKLAICYEEKTCFPDWNKISSRQEAVAKATRDFKYLKKYFNRKGYWNKNGKPVVLIFSGWGKWEHGEKLFTAEEWNKIAVESQTDNWIVLQNFKDNYPNIKAGFAWLGKADYTKWFYHKADELTRANKLEFYIGSVCPGFDDRGVWGWESTPRFEAYLGLENFNRYLTDFDNSQCDTIQVVTWNDFAEGTMIEPTVQFGNIYLNRLGEWSAKRNNKKFTGSNTILPYKWFYLAKALKTATGTISKIRNLLVDEKYIEAEKLIDKTAADNKITIPPYISYDKEFMPFQDLNELKIKATKYNAKWHSDNFLVPKTSSDDTYVLVKRNYGAVNEIARHKKDAKLLIDVLKLSPEASFTVQLLMFNNNNDYIDSIDIKKSSKIGPVKINTNQLKSDCAKIAIKIWLSGKIGSEIKFILKRQ